MRRCGVWRRLSDRHGNRHEFHRPLPFVSVDHRKLTNDDQDADAAQHAQMTAGETARNHWPSRHIPASN